jgi:Tfp pilus assembly protein PilW
MRTAFQQPHDDRRWRKAARAGHTLIELMFVSAIMIIVIGALMSAHLLGMRLNQLVQSKCGASDSSRRALQQLPLEIRSAKMWNIGNLSGTTFVAITNGAVQGTALELCATTNGSQYTLYFFDLAEAANGNGKLMRTAITNWNPVVVCSNLINTLYFTAESFNGITQSNAINGKSYKNIIHVNLQFCQFQYPQTQVGTNGLYDYYKLEFKITPHLPE